MKIKDKRSKIATKGVEVKKIIVENRAADEFRAAPSQGAASAFLFDQS